VTILINITSDYVKQIIHSNEHAPWRRMSAATDPCSRRGRWLSSHSSALRTSRRLAALRVKSSFMVQVLKELPVGRSLPGLPMG
jgi:hypothetical protein